MIIARLEPMEKLGGYLRLMHPVNCLMMGACANLELAQVIQACVAYFIVWKACHEIRWKTFLKHIQLDKYLLIRVFK
jgi:hypothetical protein